MNVRRLKQALAVSLVALLAACGGGISEPPAAAPDSGYLLTVQLEAADTREAVAQRYGGEVIAWLDGQAILRMTSEAVAQLQARGISMQNTTLESNATTEAPSATASGWNAWGSGWNAWGSGWNAWGSGWNAWSNGTSLIPTIPTENRSAMRQINLGRALALSSYFGDWNGSYGMVAVIDTGIDTAHPMFQGRLADATLWKDFVDGDNNPQEVAGTHFGHGTAVAGIIAQVVPRAKILPIRVLGSNGVGNVANVISAIQWAADNGAWVINLSLGATTNVAALRTMVEYATSRNIYVVASSGNTGNTNITFPAALATSATNNQFLISVGSVNSSGTRSSFSTSGSSLEFMAPGEQIYSAYPGNRVGFFTGTSFAAPLISGILSMGVADSLDDSVILGLQSYLVNSTTPVSGSLYGLVNMGRFMAEMPKWINKTALLVVGSTPLGPNDTAIHNRLQALGYVVSTNTAGVSTSTAATFNLVVVSASASASSLGTKLQGIEVPVVVMNNAVLGNMRMTGTAASTDYGSVSTQTQVQMLSTNSTHPLAAGLTGALTVFGSSDQVNWGRPSSSAASVATPTTSSSVAAIFGYDQGASMVGLTAPARRVGFFLGSTGGGKLNANGGLLFDAAVTWAVSGN
ncbi:MAG: S8 family serine peptidase [Meiothermus sp.]|nr:S8 family serine peptidase [Meiothermus sp.]